VNPVHYNHGVVDHGVVAVSYRNVLLMSAVLEALVFQEDLLFSLVFLKCTAISNTCFGHCTLLKWGKFLLQWDQTSLSVVRCPIRAAVLKMMLLLL